VLWIHPHETTGVKSTVVVVQLELIDPIAALIFLPSDTLEDSVDAIVRVTLADHRKGEMHEQFPHLWVCVVKRLALLAHLIVPTVLMARRGCHLQSHQSLWALEVVEGAAVEA
jgi:hypothetical protein